MPITFTCTCGQTYRAKDEQAGRNAVCPVCGKPLIIPAPPAEDEDLPVFELVADDAAAGPAVVPNAPPESLPVAAAVPVAAPEDGQEFVLVPVEPVAARAGAGARKARTSLPRRLQRAREDVFTYPCPNPQCDAILETGLEDVGKEEKCPSCHRRFIVPKPEPPGRKALVTGLCVGGAALVALGVVLVAVFLGPRRDEAPASPSGGGTQAVPVAARTAKSSTASGPSVPKAGKPPAPTVSNPEPKSAP